MLFRTKKLARVFNSEKLLLRDYGQENGRLIMRRMSVLMSVPTLGDVPSTRPERRHELTGNMAGRFAIDVKHPYCIIIAPVGNPVPRLSDSGYDLTRITAIEILGVEDYH